MTNDVDEKPERKAPEPLKCSKCGRKKGEDGVTIYSKECSICRHSRYSSKKAMAPVHDAKPAGGETKPLEPEPKVCMPVKEPCQIGKKLPGGFLTPQKVASLMRLPEDGEITVTVEFTRYPNIHKRLLELAEREFRTPANQLLYLLHDHLAGLEETAGQQKGGA